MGSNLSVCDGGTYVFFKNKTSCVRYVRCESSTIALNCNEPNSNKLYRSIQSVVQIHSVIGPLQN